jgi:hypothetical protein
MIRGWRGLQGGAPKVELMRVKRHGMLHSDENYAPSHLQRQGMSQVGHAKNAEEVEGFAWRALAAGGEGVVVRCDFQNILLLKHTQKYERPTKE